ncbi:MAG: Sodium:alanine symporter [candidate division TM6 bacterium GW2011_GWA2_36_9]|nr:MAG: Sodium:alanine symporter [candidate division TM6 bacterium GW2011_GWA2_36_9]
MYLQIVGVFMNINSLIILLKNYLWGWPLLLIIMGVGILATLATNFVQVRYFFTAWRLLLFPKKSELGAQKGAALTPFQAFLGALGTSVGNGNIAGIATAIAYGGPGAGVWILFAGFIAGLLLLILNLVTRGRGMGLGDAKLAIVGGLILGWPGSVVWLFLSFIIGAIFGIFLLVTRRVTLGRQILRFSDILTPFKVLVFFVSAIIVLTYHYQMIVPTLKLIFSSAFSYQAVAGGAAGFTLQQIIKNGFARTFNSTEAGFGVAASFFGASGSQKPVNDSIISMIGVFISTCFVCFLVAMVVVASGVWNNGAIGSALAVSAYQTVFGSYGGWVVTFVAASFGLGVMVAFLFIGKTGFFFLTNGRGEKWFYIIFCIVAFLGTKTKVEMIWDINDLVNGILLLINLYAIVFFMPLLHKAIVNYKRQ